MKIGCHVSIREGYLGAARLALRLGAESFQYFPKNPRSLSVKSFDRRDAEACKRLCRETGLISIAHTAYPVNLSVDDADLYAATIQSVRNDLEIADACGSIGLVVHFGQYKGNVDNPLHGYRQMIRMINELLADWQGESLLLLENNAGQGGRMGITMEELVEVRSLLEQPDKVGFCLDTCHAFASGMWDGQSWWAFVERAQEAGFFPFVCAVHLNNSIYPHRSFRDRHADIGAGIIPKASLLDVLRTKEWADFPAILETPGMDCGHAEEIARLKMAREMEQGPVT
jgi:deoxyribonuclease-4